MEPKTQDPCAGRRRLLQALALAGCGAPAVRALAADAAWRPDKPVRLVVPYPAGGGTDIAARLLASGIGGGLGQPIVVENRPGANGIIAADHVYASPPDGSTLLFGSGDVVSINPNTYAKVGFKPEGFVAVAPVSMIGVVLCGRSDGPARTLAELVAEVRRRELSYAHWGAGSNGRIGIEIFQTQTGAKPLLGVPYQGTAPALLGLLSGQVDLMLVPTPLVLANRAKLAVYGVASPVRYPALKDVPTLAEQGFDVDANIWFGVLAPPGTPAAAVDVLRSRIVQVVRDPAAQQKMSENGFLPDLSDPALFGQFVRAEHARWGAVVRAAGIRIE